MNSKQRRTIRRAIQSSTGLIIGQQVKQQGKKPATVLQVAPGGRRAVLVKLGNNQRQRWPLASLV